MKRIARWLATVGGLGYFPIASGTVGSAAALVIYWLTWRWPASAQLGLIAAITLVGIWAAGDTARQLGREDPGAVVIDEVAGQLLTLALTGATLWGAVAGFVLFRVLDVIKPYPANRFERLPGGLGIMADDLMAGLYGNLLLRMVFHFLPVR